MGNNTVITIGRQLGSCGRKIGKKLAEELNIAFYDKDLIAKAAKESGLSENLFEGMDERPTNSFLYSLVMGLNTGHGIYHHYDDVLGSDNLFKIQSTVIRNVAAEGPCVIVGRCADYILRNEPNLIRVFIHADEDWRKLNVAAEDEIEVAEAVTRLRKIDKRRSNYYNFYTNRTWGDVDNYDIAVNSGAIGVDNTVALLAQFVKMKTEM